MGANGISRLLVDGDGRDGRAAPVGTDQADAQSPGKGVIEHDSYGTGGLGVGGLDIEAATAASHHDDTPGEGVRIGGLAQQ